MQPKTRKAPNEQVTRSRGFDWSDDDMTNKEVLAEMLTDPVFWAGTLVAIIVLGIIWGIGKL